MCGQFSFVVVEVLRTASHPCPGPGPGLQPGEAASGRSRCAFYVAYSVMCCSAYARVWTALSFAGGTTPRTPRQPWRCLCRGSEQITMTRPWRRMIRHLLQIFLTLGLTFTANSRSLASLLVPVDDATAAQVVRAESHDHPVVGQDPDVVHPHLPADVGEYLVPVVQLHAEEGIGQRLDHRAFDLDGAVFLGHILRVSSCVVLVWCLGCSQKLRQTGRAGRRYSPVA